MREATSWIAARLELARTPEFPEGSPARAYILHVPVDSEGLIDEQQLLAHPGRTLVRRFWPNEPDLVGMIVRAGEGWACSYRDGPDDDERLFHLSDHPIVAGNYLTIEETGGQSWPFRIAETSSL